MRMGNPSLRRWVSKSQKGELATEIQPATYKGIYGKASLYAIVTIVAAIAAELSVVYAFKSDLLAAVVGIGVATAVCGIALLVISLIIMFVPTSVKILGLIYSVLQGGLLGCLALFVDVFVSPGISLAALLGTGIVFLVSVAVNRLFDVKVGNRFVRGLLIAGVSIMLVQLVMFVMSLFGVFDYKAYLWIQVVASSICIIWATLMLTWDLKNIDFLVQSGADKKYEWNVAFSLVTTLVYLYLEILELLMRLAMLFGDKKN